MGPQSANGTAARKRHENANGESQVPFPPIPPSCANMACFTSSSSVNIFLLKTMFLFSCLPNERKRDCRAQTGPQRANAMRTQTGRAKRHPHASYPTCRLGLLLCVHHVVCMYPKPATLSHANDNVLANSCRLR